MLTIVMLLLVLLLSKIFTDLRSKKKYAFTGTLNSTLENMHGFEIFFSSERGSPYMYYLTFLKLNCSI